MGREYPGQPVVGVGAVVLRSPADREVVEVLLARRGNAPSQGEWSLPGGVVELGERLEQAVVREVFEETGLRIQAGPIIEVLDSIVKEAQPAPGSSHDQLEECIRFHYVLIDFLCHVTGGRLGCASDATAVCWQRVGDLSSAGEHALRPKTIEVIQKALALYLARPKSE